jgi:hypothetical protein
MPAGLLPDEGIAKQLEYILSAPIAGELGWKLLFFVNDIIPTRATRLADLVEATWGGYVRLTMDRDRWTVPTVTNGCAKSTWGTQNVSWTCTDGKNQTNYGYAYLDWTRGVLRFVQRFDANDIRPVVTGDRVLILPTYTLTSAECAGGQ